MPEGFSFVTEDLEDNSGRIQCFASGTKHELAYLNWVVREEGTFSRNC